MSKKLEQNYNRIVGQEFNRSLRFQKKHEKEINTLLAYQQQMKQEKIKNEFKLQKLFQKEMKLDIEKKQKEALLKEIKVNKDQQHLHKIKEQEYLQSLDSSWCFYHDVSPGRDMKPKIINSERQQVLNLLEHQLQIVQDPLEKASLKSKISKLKHSEIQFSKINTIDVKQKHAQILRSESLDKSIDKIKQHDIHILDVLEKGSSINQEKYQYYKNKFDIISEKIKIIEEEKKLALHSRKYFEQRKEQQRQFVKSNSQQILLQRDIIHQNHLEEKNRKIQSLEEKKIRLVLEKQHLLDQMNQQRQQVRKEIENVRYPALNSINYKALLY